MYFIEVILPLSLSQTFTYSVCLNEFESLQIGMRVAVPFGKSKIYTALVVEKHGNQPTLYDAKEIHQLLDEKPIVNAQQIKHWFWISDYYMCSIGEVYKAAIPSALLLESETVIKNTASEFANTNDLTDDEFLVFQALQKQSVLKIGEIEQITGRKNVLPLIKKMIDKNYLIIDEEVYEEYKPKLVRYIKLTALYTQEGGLEKLLEIVKNAPKQKEVILSYFQLASKSNEISVKNITEFAKVTAATIKSLLDKNVFEEYYIQQDRINYMIKEKDEQVTLNSFQQIALQNIITSFQTKDVCLLHGITASGKTEVYLKLIEQYIHQKGQIVYLIPEIALASQFVKKFQSYFGNKVAVYHSKYNNHEKVEIWNQILNNSEKATILIGTRSALFLPFSNLKLLIIDEEQEQTYKQNDPAPRYHARDAAIVLAKLHQAKVLLGSATPTLETYHNTINQKFGLVALNEKYSQTPPPQISLIDLKDKYKRKRMTGHFSDELITEISTTLSQGEQVILFQNRRGFSPIVECKTCGHVPQCTQCNVSLTYHKSKNQLQCHYCGFTMAKPTHCHACSSSEISTKGFGTEQLEIETKLLFPEAKIGRIDQDTTRGKFAFDVLLDAFKSKEIDILIGTQMLAKGIDFDNVTLVGVLNTDNMLYHPDFRSFEKTFQLLIQLAGRSGRTEKIGKVLIQTYNPNHTLLTQVVQNDYIGMFQEQLNERKQFKYPPYYRLIKLTFKHKDFEKLKEAAFWFYQVLTQNLQIPIFGPEEPPINRIRNQFIRVIQIKIPHNYPLIGVKNTIKKTFTSFESISQYRSVIHTINVDYT